MKYGFARISSIDQNADIQMKALRRAGRKQTFKDELSGATTKRTLFVALLALIAPCLFAGTPVEIWTPSDLKTAAAQLAKQPDASAVSGKTLGAYGSHSISLWRRAKSGQAELHKTKTDLMIIEEGSATLLVGGSIPDAHSTQANELRGASIRGGESKKVGPGDIIRIPPGTPHQFLLEPGQTIAYFAVKLNR